MFDKPTRTKKFPKKRRFLFGHGPYAFFAWRFCRFFPKIGENQIAIFFNLRYDDYAILWIVGLASARPEAGFRLGPAVTVFGKGVAS